MLECGSSVWRVAKTHNLMKSFISYIMVDFTIFVLQVNLNSGLNTNKCRELL